MSCGIRRAILVVLLVAFTGPTARMQPRAPQEGAAASQQSGALTYSAALDLAIRRNASLAAAVRKRAIREARVRIAQQWPNPEFSFEASRDVPHEVVSLAFPVEIGGKRGRRIELAREEVSIADVDVRDAERMLRRNLRLAFYGLLIADQRVGDADALVAIARRVREAAQARFAEGAAPRLEVMEADLALARAEADLDLSQSGRATSRADLNAVLDQPAGQPVMVAGNPAEMVRAASYEEVLEAATASNVDLVRVNREIAVERRRTSMLRAERLPTPTISIGGVFDAPGEFRSGLSGGLSLAVPLFSRNQGEIAESNATVLQLQAEREAVLRTLESTLYGAWARLQAHARQVQAYRERLLPVAADIESLAEESYREGRSALLSLLEAQRNLRDLRREYLQVLSDYQSAVADLEEILGAPMQ